MLAVFDTAIGAVTAALAIQDEISPLTEAVPEDRRMRFRIGIHMGDVIEKSDGTVYGTYFHDLQRAISWASRTKAFRVKVSNGSLPAHANDR